jgi:bacterioferritin-associated ferredoxin
LISRETSFQLTELGGFAQDDMRIDRCICFNKSFRELSQLAERHGVSSVEELQGIVEFGRNCGLCRPYVREMLTTGEVIFRRIISDESAKAGDGRA